MEMKNLIAFLAFVAMVALASCSDTTRENGNNSTTGNAALELYYKYAGNENLTVAYLGDFSLNGNKIDALMIQANDEEDWNRLKAEFGMAPQCDSITQEDGDPAANPEDKKVISIGVGLDADFIKELGLDTITDLNQVDEERFKKMTEIIAEKISDIVNSFPLSDTTLPANATIKGDGPVEGLDITNITMEEYLNTLAQAIGAAMLNEVIVKNTEAGSVENDMLADSTIVDAREYGHSGYVSAADAANSTLWLFFYDDQEECNNILTHIKDDIIINK